MHYIFTPDPHYKNGLLACLKALKRGDSLEIPGKTSGAMQTQLRRLRPRSFTCRLYETRQFPILRWSKLMVSGVIVTRNWKPRP